MHEYLARRRSRLNRSGKMAVAIVIGYLFACIALGSAWVYVVYLIIKALIKYTGG